MPSFEPFPGIRYALDRADLAAVTAPPYDVISPAQRDAILARDPHNVLAVDLPVAVPGAATDGDPYGDAAACFQAWLDEGVLVRDEPSFYVYRMRYQDERGVARHTTGVFGALELSRPGEGGILPHEQTTPKAKSDRLDLMRATHANLSAVWGLSPAGGLTALLDDGSTPDAEWSDEDGVEHALWLVTDPDRIEKIRACVASEPVVIADGHHRYETALAYRDERLAAGADPDGAASVLCYVVELVDDELTVLPIHRLLSSLPADLDLRAALDAWFVVTPAGPPDHGILATMQQQQCLVLVERGRTSLLSPRPGAFAGLRDLDTVRLDAALAGLPEHELRYQHGIDHVVSAVESGEADAGILLRPARVRQIVDIAHGGNRMPPKTTFFHPKPRTGVVFRTLD